MTAWWFAAAVLLASAVCGRELETIECEFDTCYDVMDMTLPCHFNEMDAAHRMAHEELAASVAIADDLVASQVNHPHSMLTSPEMWDQAVQRGISAPMLRCNLLDAEEGFPEIDTDSCRWETVDEKITRMNVYIVRCNRGVNSISGNRHNPWLQGHLGGVMPGDCGFNCWLRKPDAEKYRSHSGCGKFYVTDEEFETYSTLVARYPLKNCLEIPGEGLDCENMKEMRQKTEKLGMAYPDVECPEGRVRSCRWQSPEKMRAMRFKMEMRCLQAKDPYDFEDGDALPE